MTAHMFLAGNVEEGYTVTPGFMQDMLHRFKDQKLIHRRYAFAIILQVSLPTMLSHYVVFSYCMCCLFCRLFADLLSW